MKKFLAVVCTLVLSAGLYAATSVVGTWNFYYDWDCNGGYASTTITFNNNGTFTSQSYTGTWYAVESQIIWKYPSGTTYAGSKVGGVMSGMMATTWSALKGCWYCKKQAYVSMAPKAEENLDATGVIQKKGIETKTVEKN
jgi:hypothetical protein